MKLSEYQAAAKQKRVGRGVPTVQDKRALALGPQTVKLAPDEGQNGLWEVDDFGSRQVEIEVVEYDPAATKIRCGDRFYYAR